MVLTTKQIREIEDYISSCGIKYYDVKVEIVDHFATVLEQRLLERPELEVKTEIMAIHEEFGEVGFYELCKEKTKAVHKSFYSAAAKHLLGFLRLPKILVAIVLFLGLNEVLKMTVDKRNFFFALSVLGVLLMLQMLIRVVVNKKKSNISFLVLNKSDHFMQLINFLFITFNTSVNFRADLSYENDVYNQIHLGVYLILVLFYFSGEYVFRQNKKMILQQYPTLSI